LLALWLPNFLVRFVNRVGGQRLHYDRAHALAEDIAFTRAAIAEVRALLDTERERGKVWALCPGCRTWEAEMTFTAYALTIACPIPSTFDGPFLTVPSVATRTLLGYGRAPIRRAAQIRFEVPSGELAGILHELKHQPEEWQPPPEPPDSDDDDDKDFDEEAEDDDTTFPPSRDGAGWCALLRLSRAIEPAVTVEQLEALSAIDFFFIDLVHFLVAYAPVKADTPGKLTCPTCATVFLPVRPDPGH
jgi:hypothetical protein